MSFLETSNALNKTPNIVTHCRNYLSGKYHQLHFNKFNSISTNPLKLICSDVWVPKTYNFCGWIQIFTLFLLMTFLNSLGFIYLNSSLMSSTFFKYFKDAIENQLNLKLRFLDQMVELDSHLTPLQTFALRKVLYMNSPIHVIPKQNGVAMRKHRRFCECSRTMLSNSKLPLSYWSYVVTTTIHIINRIPTPWLHHKSPWELLFNS